MKELFSITKDLLNSLNMSRSQIIDNKEYQKYFIGDASEEHYRLLTYISQNFDDELFIDIGTLKGCSALALSSNPNNKVLSFNLVEQRQLNQFIPNCNFVIDNVMNPSHKESILKSKLILLDTNHDGSFENLFYDYLKLIGFKGYLLLDDIHLNREMKIFWNSIELPKEDLTHLGHATGTGVVYFE